MRAGKINFILRKPTTLINGTYSNAVCTLLPCQRVRFALHIHSFKNKIFSAKCTVTPKYTYLSNVILLICRDMITF